MSDAIADTSDMQALQRGEDAALNRLMERWQRRLHAYLTRVVGHPEDARDLAQETFVRIYRHRDRFRSGARFSTWMFQIALNLGRDHLRHRRRRPQDQGTADRPEVPGDEPHPLRRIELGETAKMVRAAVNDLPAALHEPLVLATYESLSHAEIAQITGTSPKAVESRLYRARDLLRQRLQHWL